MAIIKITENFEQDKENISKLFDEGLIGIYHMKAEIFSKDELQAEPANAARPGRQTENTIKFNQPLDDHDAEVNYEDELDEECDGPRPDDPDTYRDKVFKDPVLDNVDTHLNESKEGLDAGSMDIRWPVMRIAIDKGEQND